MDPSRGNLVACALVAAAVALVAAPTPTLAGEREADRTHVVSPGNTLGSIARRYHVTIAALREANGLGTKQPIRLGQKLVIPTGSAETEPASRSARRGGEQDEELEGGTARSRRARREKATADSREGASVAAGSASGSAFARAPRRPGSVQLVHGDDRATVKLPARKKRLTPLALDAFSRMLRYYPTGARHPIDPRLVTLVGVVSDHFGGRELHIVSGFRPHSPSQYTPHSNHNLGRAMDFKIPGVPNEVVRDFCRTLRNVGVGYYPNSSFVHLDVRAEPTFWVDEAGPGEAPRYLGKNGKGQAGEGGDEEGDDGSTETQDPASENPYF